jgi:hypothetical protein
VPEEHGVLYRAAMSWLANQQRKRGRNSKPLPKGIFDGLLRDPPDTRREACLGERFSQWLSAWWWVR